MSSVDDLLREAFAADDDRWAARAPVAREEVARRHDRARRRDRARLVAGTGIAATLAVAALVVTDGDAPRGVPPAEPVPTATDPAASALEGTWVSGILGSDDVRAAARRAGAPGSAAMMLEQLGTREFRVLLTVEGTTLTASVSPMDAAGPDEVIDVETLAVDGVTLRLTPADTRITAEQSTHTWRIDDGRLRMRFATTTGGSVAGVPSEAWQRLLYDAGPFTGGQ